MSASAPFQIFIIDPDGSNRFALPNQPSNTAVPSFSPDGLSLCFEAKVNGRYEVFTMKIDGTDLHQITTQGGYDSIWSPAGNRLVFTSNRDGNSELYIINVDGSGERRLTYNTDYDDDASWAPDGRRIVFETKRGTNVDLYILDVDTGVEHPFLITSLTESTPVWSPDGEWIAFEQDPDGQEDIYTIVVVPAPDTAGNVAIDKLPKQITDWGAVRWRPAWSPDSQQVAFTSDSSGSYEIWITNVDSGNLRQLTFDNGAVNATWSRR